MREIVVDTETTGLDPYQGHRLVEIGCIELVNRIPSGQVFHRYINPERDIPAEVTAIHGIDNARVKDEKVFSELVDDLAAFLGDAPLVAHNAMFDLGFINAEMERCGKPVIARERMVDTLLLARRKYPGGQIVSTIFARATALTTHAAPNTVRCSTRSCSPKSTWS